jgi:hypothetical protein
MNIIMGGCKSCSQNKGNQQVQPYTQKYINQSVVQKSVEQKPSIQVDNIGFTKLNELAAVLRSDPNNTIIQNQIRMLIQHHSK